MLGCREEALFNEPWTSGNWTEDFLENARSFSKAVLQFAQLKTLKIYVPIEQNPQPPRFDNFVQGDKIHKLIANRFFGILMRAAEEEGVYDQNYQLRCSRAGCIGGLSSPERVLLDAYLHFLVSKRGGRKGFEIFPIITCLLSFVLSSSSGPRASSFL
jgi:hypothetical protein